MDFNVLLASKHNYNHNKIIFDILPIKEVRVKHYVRAYAVTPRIACYLSDVGISLHYVISSSIIVGGVVR